MGNSPHKGKIAILIRHVIRRRVGYILLCALLGVIAVGCGVTRPKLHYAVIIDKVADALRKPGNLPGPSPFPCPGIYFDSLEVTVKRNLPDYTGMVHVRAGCSGEVFEADFAFKMSTAKPRYGTRRRYSAFDPARWSLDKLTPYPTPSSEVSAQPEEEIDGDSEREAELREAELRKAELIRMQRRREVLRQTD